MLTVDRISVMNMENAIRGARNPLNSWARMDSYYDEKGNFVLGENDLALARRLAVAGSDHRKYLRQIIVSMDINAPLYWWKEFVRDDFSHDRLTEEGIAALDALVAFLEAERVRYNETLDKSAWHNMIQLLPSSFNQLRTVTLNYEVLINIYYARKTHKLAEWHTLCHAIESLPYARELILVKEKNNG